MTKKRSGRPRSEHESGAVAVEETEHLRISLMRKSEHEPDDLGQPGPLDAEIELLDDTIITRAAAKDGSSEAAAEPAELETLRREAERGALTGISRLIEKDHCRFPGTAYNIWKRARELGVELPAPEIRLQPWQPGRDRPKPTDGRAVTYTHRESAHEFSEPWIVKNIRRQQGETRDAQSAPDQEDETGAYEQILSGAMDLQRRQNAGARGPVTLFEPDDRLAGYGDYDRIHQLEDTVAEYTNSSGSAQKCEDHPAPTAQILKRNTPVVNEAAKITIHLLGKRYASKNRDAVDHHDPIRVETQLEAPFAFRNTSRTTSQDYNPVRAHDVIMTRQARELYDERDMEAILRKSFQWFPALSASDTSAPRETAIALYRTADEWRRKMITIHASPVLSRYGPDSAERMTITMRGSRENGWETTIEIEPTDAD